MKAFCDLPHGRIYRISEQKTFGLAIELALTTSIRLLICDNRLPFYNLAYALARRVGQRYAEILEARVYFSRAETCIQLLDFLCEMQADPAPVLVSGMLARFYDEDERQVDELFFQCQVELQRLSKSGLVFISANSRPPLERLGCVLNRITREVDPASFLQVGEPHGAHPTAFFPTV